MLFPGLNGLPLGKVLIRTVKEFIDDEMSTYASALAYQMLFSLFPFILFLIALIGFLHLPGTVQESSEDMCSGIRQRLFRTAPQSALYPCSLPLYIHLSDPEGI